MASCETCWERSGGDVEKYHRLLRENDCSPEEQAGAGATECQFCGRKTIHQYAGVCVNPDCAAEARAKSPGANIGKAEEEK